MASLSEKILIFKGQAQQKIYEIGNDIRLLKDAGRDQEDIAPNFFYIKELRWAIQLLDSGLTTITDDNKYEYIHYLQRKYDLNTSSALVVGQLVNNIPSGKEYVKGPDGDDGGPGDQGDPGATGARGSFGGPITINYTFSTTTGDADPGSGFLRLNQAAQNTSTVIRVDLLDAGAIDWTSVIDSFDDSTSTLKGYIRLVNATDYTKWIVFSVASIASPSGYRNITATVVGASSASPFANGDSVLLCYGRIGDKGDIGSTGDDGATGPAGPGVNEDCVVATTANLAATYNSGAMTLTATSNGAISIDSVSLSLNNRILVKDQSTGSQNGIYTVTTVGSAGAPYVLTRASDFNTTLDAKGFYWVFISSGTANSGKRYTLTTDKSTLVLDTTTLVFSATNHPMQNIGINKVYGNVSGPDPGPPQEVEIMVEWGAVPATLSSTGKRGAKAADDVYVYMCYLSNTWTKVKRAHAPIDIDSSDSPYTALATNEDIWVDASAGAVTVSLPSAGGALAEKEFLIKKIDSSFNAVTIDPDGSETIDGNATVAITTQYTAYRIKSNGTNWYII
jgi:hypothetical protein